MKPLKLFEEYLKLGIVKKIKVDSDRAKSLILISERKMNSLNEKLEKIGIRDDNANEYLENCYDSIMLLIRAKLFLDGYNSSGISAHESEVSYLRDIGFNESEVQFVNQMRYFRNGMLYYGTLLDKEYALKVIKFTKEFYLKLRKIVNKT